jgi:hypothetical protein
MRACRRSGMGRVGACRDVAGLSGERRRRLDCGEQVSDRLGGQRLSDPARRTLHGPSVHRRPILVMQEILQIEVLRDRVAAPGRPASRAPGAAGILAACVAPGS